jgi:hypothetical protein
MLGGLAGVVHDRQCAYGQSTIEVSAINNGFLHRNLEPPRPSETLTGGPCL